MTSWLPMSLKQAGVVLIDCVHATPAPVTSGFPYVAIPQMTDGRIDFDDARKISCEDFVTWTKKARPRKFDVVLSRRTNPGVVAPVADRADFALGQNLVLLRADGSHVAPEFLLWLTTSPQWWAQIEKFMNVGAIFNSLRCGDVPNFVLPIPPIREQGAIAAILSALDDKIELNRRMNETLEASARALFRDWFVDFGPTRAKAEGRPAWLAPDLWSLFPNRLGDDGVPEGWDIGTLADIAEVSPKEPIKRGVVAPYLDMAALPTVGANSKSPMEREYASGTRFRNGDTLLARITPCLENGKTAYIQGLPDGAIGWGSTEFIVLRAKSPVPKPVTYLIARDEDFRRHAIRSMTGTSGRQRAEANAIAGYPLVLPSDPQLWDSLSTIVEPIFERIEKNEQESRTLAATRDALLPKLMSGEIRVAEAEALAA